MVQISGQTPVHRSRKRVIFTVRDFGAGWMYTAKFARQGDAVTGIDLPMRSNDYAKDVAERNQLPIK